MKTTGTVLYLITSVLIGLGAFGHSFGGARQVVDVLGNTGVPGPMYDLILTVWYFAGACMFVLALVLIYHWWMFRSGATAAFVVPYVIGAFYVGFGVLAVYLIRQPFFISFVVLGLLLITTSALISRAG